MKRIGFILVGLLLHTYLVYAAPIKDKRSSQNKNVFQRAIQHLYVTPSIRVGALYRSDGMQISGPYSIALLGLHYKFSNQLAITFTGHHRVRYENQEGEKLYFDTYDLAGKYRFYAYKPPGLKRPIHVYGQGGLWHAYSTEISSEGVSCNTLKGSGLLGGIGARYERSRVFVDVSYKYLQPLFHTEIAGAHLISFGVGIRLF